jgi:hypothetical protein
MWHMLFSTMRLFARTSLGVNRYSSRILTVSRSSLSGKIISSMKLRSHRQWLILLTFPLLTLVYMVGGIRALINHKSLTFDATVLFVNSAIVSISLMRK